MVDGFWWNFQGISGTWSMVHNRSLKLVTSKETKWETGVFVLCFFAKHFRLGNLSVQPQTQQNQNMSMWASITMFRSHNCESWLVLTNKNTILNKPFGVNYICNTQQYEHKPPLANVWIPSKYTIVFGLQIFGIFREYKELEDKLLKLRDHSKAKLTELLEEEVGRKLNKLTRQILKINSRVYSHHQVRNNIGKVILCLPSILILMYIMKWDCRLVFT